LAGYDLSLMLHRTFGLAAATAVAALALPAGAAAASAIPLNPVNSSRISETVVELPLEKLQSGNYLVAVQNATAHRQFAQTCARLSR
jgi:hypothetical protein